MKLLRALRNERPQQLLEPAAVIVVRKHARGKCPAVDLLARKDLVTETGRDGRRHRVFAVELVDHGVSGEHRGAQRLEQREAVDFPAPRPPVSPTNGTPIRNRALRYSAASGTASS